MSGVPSAMGRFVPTSRSIAMTAMRTPTDVFSRTASLAPSRETAIAL